MEPPMILLTKKTQKKMPKKGRRKRARRMSHPRSKPKYN
jgi:hypothetical protein